MHFLTLLLQPKCFVCGATARPGFHWCELCLLELANKSAEGQKALFTYEGRAVKSLLYELRTPQSLGALKLVGDKIAQTDFPAVDFVAAAPQNNKSGSLQKIAKKIAEKNRATFLPAVFRKKYRHSQHGRAARQRLDAALFVELCGRQRFAGRKVLVIDDVSTTGTTLAQCQQLLRASGAEEVAAYALARRAWKFKGEDQQAEQEGE